MTRTRAQVLIANQVDRPWARSLETHLRPLPVDLHWTHSDYEAFDLVSEKIMHLAVVDGALPGGGINLVRRVRSVGLNVPTLLVCDQPDARVLQDALALNVYSVLTPDDGPADTGSQDIITPVVFKLFRQVYRFDWAAGDSAN